MATPRPPDFPAIRLRGLTVAYPGSDRPAIDDLTIDVVAGSVLGLMGATGAGKTTLGLLLDGIVPHLVPAEIVGDILVDGVDPRGVVVREMARRVAIVPDTPEVGIAAGTVAEEVALGLEHQGASHAEMEIGIPWVLGLVGLAGLEDRSPATLSGGQRQRLAIAAAVVTGPDLLFLDEPTASLDAAGVRSLIELVRRVRAEAGLTVVIADHDPDLIADLADRVILLREGHVALDGPPERVLADPPMLSALGIRARRTGPGARFAAVTAASASARPQREAGPVVASVAGVSYAYPGGVTALRDVSLEVHAGEVLGIAGANGSGKTTLTKVFDGLIRPTAGSVRVLDQAVVRPAAPWVGYVFQDPDRQLFASTVAAELAFGPRNVGLAEAEVRDRVRETAAHFGLTELLERHPARLPRPLRTLVAVASVLAMRPRILVLDEPTAGQDAPTIARIEAAIRDHRDGGGAVVCVSHDVVWLASIADRLAVLADGRLAAVGDTATVLARFGEGTR